MGREGRPGNLWHKVPGPLRGDTGVSCDHGEGGSEYSVTGQSGLTASPALPLLLSQGGGVAGPGFGVLAPCWGVSGSEGPRLRRAQSERTFWTVSLPSDPSSRRVVGQSHLGGGCGVPPLS